MRGVQERNPKDRESGDLLRALALVATAAPEDKDVMATSEKGGGHPRARICGASRINPGVPHYLIHGL